MDEIKLRILTEKYRRMIEGAVHSMLFSTSLAFTVATGKETGKRKEYRCFLMREYESSYGEPRLASMPVLIIELDSGPVIIRGLAEPENSARTMSIIYRKTYNEDLAYILSEAIRRIDYKYPAAFTFEKRRPLKGL